MPAVHRVGDLSAHLGTVSMGAVTVHIGGIPVARVGDPCLELLHGPQVIETGAARVHAEGKPLARQGDTLGCGATLTPTQFTVNAG